MKQIHKGGFKVNKPDVYAKLVQSGDIQRECKIRGNHLVSLKRIGEKEWEYEAVVDTANPRLDEIATLLEDLYSISYTLTSVPKIKNICEEGEKTLNDLKKEIKKVKEDLLTVT